MSIKALVWAFEQKVTPSEKLVLLALADHADDQGICWPFIKTVARKSCLSARTVKRCIATLKKRKLIDWKHRHKEDGCLSSSRYTLFLNGTGGARLALSGEKDEN